MIQDFIMSLNLKGLATDSQKEEKKKKITGKMLTILQSRFIRRSLVRVLHKQNLCLHAFIYTKTRESLTPKRKHVEGVLFIVEIIFKSVSVFIWDCMLSLHWLCWYVYFFVMLLSPTVNQWNSMKPQDVAGVHIVCVLICPCFLL